MKWISTIIEEHPCLGTDVLVWDGTEILIAHTSRDEKTRAYIFVDPQFGRINNVTHWMPLPEPPTP